MSVRKPGEFQYWEQAKEPEFVWLRRVLGWVFGVEPVLSEEQLTHYAASFFDADPVAEAFVEEVYLRRGREAGRALLDRALAQGVESVPEVPASMCRLFDDFERAPSWLDESLVEEGARVFRRLGTSMYTFAGAITLEGYRENSVARPLVLTGAYTGSTAHHRFLETARFWLDVSSPGGLAPGGQGRKTCMRVRIMHVFVRERLLSHPEWDLDAWGVPISHGDAIMTLMGGSFLPGYGLKVLGYRISEQEVLAMMHFWRYIGHLLGVQPKWYPTTIQEALALSLASQIKGVRGSGRDGVLLAQSYVASYAPVADDSMWLKVVKGLDYQAQLGYVWLFLPGRTHRFYGLPKPGPLGALPFLKVPGRWVLETLRRRSTHLDQWLTQRALEESERWVASRLGERPAEFKAVETFTR